MGRRNNIEGQLNLFDLSWNTEEEQGTGTLEEAGERKRMPEDAKEETRYFTPGSFPECTACWCATCEHSSVGGSKPRPFGDKFQPCPSCELCVGDGKADVCVIGSAKEGCSYRAGKEGIVEEEPI